MLEQTSLSFQEFDNQSTQSIIQGDCLEKMREMTDNSIDCIVTDPPYGLHFMGKDWDGRIPAMEIWAEALRVCKPGAHLLAFGGTRTHHHLMCAIEGGGWEIRDCLMWIYGSGFPKSHNHFGLKGYGTALKPAYEPIILAMKPIDGTFAQNAEKWGVGGLNIDGCRIEGSWKDVPPNENSGRSNGILGKKVPHPGGRCHSNGRWPANILFDEEAAVMLDEQSGKLLGAGNKLGTNRKQNASFVPNQSQVNFKYDNGGGASRFFYCAKASSKERNTGLEGMPLKPGGSNAKGFTKDIANGLDRNKPVPNHHPTVKPLKLMEYLLKLVMPPNPNAIVLDPFAGSGSNLLAAKNLGFNAIGIEKQEEYCEIAKKRVGI